VIVDSAAGFRRALAGGACPPDADALPRGVFMVEPDEFHVSTESAIDNKYMDLEHEADPERAWRQFTALKKLIEDCGVPVTRFPGHPETPDDVFPNNVFATIPGRLVVGRMLRQGRRLEAEREDIRDWFSRRGYQTVDLSRRALVAELTGCMNLDRARRVGYCGMTRRVDRAGLEAMHEAFDNRISFAFDLQPQEYHTNVVMMVLAGRACVIHPPAFVDQAVPEAIASVYPGHTLLLDTAEKNAFAGNCIALTERDLFMSRSAADALRPGSRAALESWGFRLRTARLDEFEKAGGSLRCMVGEIF
jgi:hypothetical protein